MGKSTQEQDTRLLILKKEVVEHRIRRTVGFKGLPSADRNHLLSSDVQSKHPAPCEGPMKRSVKGTDKSASHHWPGRTGCREAQGCKDRRQGTESKEMGDLSQPHDPQQT